MAEHQLHVVSTSTAVIVALEGEHDVSQAARLETTLSAVLARGTSVVIDLTPCKFLDSRILGVIFNAHRRAAEGQTIAVVAPPGSMARRIVDLAALNTLIPLFDATQDALAPVEHHLP